MRTFKRHHAPWGGIRQGGVSMVLWWEWLQCVQQLRPACARRSTFLWMIVVLAGLSMRSEVAGVSSFITGPGTQSALLPTAALSVSYPGIKIGTAAGVLDKAGVEVVHALARGRALGVDRRWAQGGQGRAENAGGQEASSKLREQLQSKLHLWTFVSSLGNAGPWSIGASVLRALDQ